MANESFANSLVVEVAGRPLPDDVKTLLTYAYVDNSRNLPDVFVLRFRDPGHVVLGKGGFEVGVKIDLKVQTADPGGPQLLMSGEITAVGLDLDRTGTFTEVRGYDHAHRLCRRTDVGHEPGRTHDPAHTSGRCEAVFSGPPGCRGSHTCAGRARARPGRRCCG